MRIDDRGLDIAVTQQFLDRADVLATFQKVGAEGMAQGVVLGCFADARRHHSPPTSLPDQRRVQCVAAFHACGGITSAAFWRPVNLDVELSAPSPRPPGSLFFVSPTHRNQSDHLAPQLDLKLITGSEVQQGGVSLAD